MKAIYLCEKPANIKNVFGVDSIVYKKTDITSLPEKFKDTEFVFSSWGMPQFAESEIRKCLPSLKAVFYAAGSVQAFARPFLNCGVKVFSAWEANAVPVAEYTVAQIVLANKGFFKTMRYTSRGAARKEFENFPGNYDVNVGLLGAGAIGKLVTSKLKEYRLNVMVYDLFISSETAKSLGAEKCELADIFKRCAVVSNHVADNEQTKNMIDEKLLSTLPPYSTFINTGRGAQVVEEDLIKVLKSRPDITAILDVTSPEPPREGSELYTLDNCILTPHIAGSSGKEVRRMGEYMMSAYDAFVSKDECIYEVTLDMLDTMA